MEGMHLDDDTTLSPGVDDVSSPLLLRSSSSSSSGLNLRGGTLSVNPTANTTLTHTHTGQLDCQDCAPTLTRFAAPYSRRSAASRSGLIRASSRTCSLWRTLSSAGLLGRGSAD